MATSTLYLYSCDIIPEANAFVEDIEIYLSSKLSKTITDFMYIKNDLNISIKIQNAQKYITNPIYNYIKVVNSDDTRNYYYFITGANWKSQDCIEYTCMLDTINTYQYELRPNQWSNHTHIMREHKDRFNGVYGNNTYYRYIDHEDEGIQCLLHRTNKKAIYHSNYEKLNNIKWFMVISSFNTNIHPVKVDFLPSGVIKYNNNEILSASYINRTHEKLIAIYELPYLPCNYEVDDNGNITVSSSDVSFITQAREWSFAPVNRPILQVVSVINDYKAYVSGSKLINNLINEPLLAVNNINKHTLRDIKYESKLYNSNFYKKAFVYDSFVYYVDFENYNFEGDFSEGIYTEIEYAVSYNISNTSFFKFKLLDSDDTEFGKISYLDFDNYLMISRNNQQSIYSSDYINYIRNGYNYDVKNRNLAETKALIGTAFQFAEATANLATGNTKGAIGGYFAGTQSIFNNIIQEEVNENNMQKSLAMKQAQGVSINGSDDVGMLNYYKGDILYMMTYEPRDEMKSLLFDLFYKYGYACNYYGIPVSFDTKRVWFNHIKCDLQLKPVAKAKLLQYYNNIHERYFEGVTYYHKNIIDGVAEWDFEQKYENFENWIL